MTDALHFEWPQLRVALEGRSSIDFPRLHLKSKAEAKLFLLSYGYDIEDPLVREEVWRIYFQSLAFIRTHLLDPGEEMPVELMSRGSQSEIVKLLLEASTRGSTLGRWSCSILRVMHIISHLDNDLRSEFFQYARDQIFERFNKLVVPAGPRRWEITLGNRKVTIIRYLRKYRKDRDSTLTKLLSKPTAIAEEIYDRIGIRFVTETRFDAYHLVQILFEVGAISVANIQPGRSVNSLLPLEVLEQSIEQMRSEIARGELSPQAAELRLRKIEEEGLVAPTALTRNPFSSSWYRAIQFTCRQLITAPTPAFRLYQEMKAEFDKTKAGAAMLKKVPIMIRENRSFYYPFEIQILDKESYVESIGGRSRHREYKAKQRLLARNRVLRDLV